MTVKTDGTKNYAGVKTGYYAQLPSVTGAFYSDGRLYYALSGQTSLRYRYFTPDSGTIGGQEFTATGGNFANIAGMFLSGNTLYYANRSDGSLHSLAFTDGGTNGQNPSVDASTDAVVSGPALDGNDWRSRSMFAFGQASFPDQPPTAVASGSCTVLTCSFDGTLSSDPDGSVASYAWDFGDGTTGTGATPTHGYAAAGTYTYMLTVTDDRGVASTPVLGSVTTTGLTTPIAFNSVTHGYKNGATSVSVTTPGTVAAGDTELLYVSAVNTVANAIVAPAGWTLVASQSPLPLQVAVFQKTAAATDAGSVVTASVTSASQLAVQLVDYSNVAATALVAAAATDAATASHTAPAVGVANGGSWVVSFWADKSSSTTAWTLPATVAQRDQTIGINGGRVTAALADSGVPVPSGTYPAQTATVGATASAKGAMISLVLAPTS
jgi:PKD repeat protein